MVTKDAVFEVVKGVVLETLPHLSPDDVLAHKSLVDLGANSLDRMEVVTLSMQELGLKLPLMTFAGVSNLQGLVDVLHHHRAALPS
jgi:polyketide biosynthesis acyl carrier protein